MLTVNTSVSQQIRGSVIDAMIEESLYNQVPSNIPVPGSDIDTIVSDGSDGSGNDPKKSGLNEAQVRNLLISTNYWDNYLFINRVVDYKVHCGSWYREKSKRKDFFLTYPNLIFSYTSISCLQIYIIDICFSKIQSAPSISKSKGPALFVRYNGISL